jgi:hypothetical protein
MQIILSEELYIHTPSQREEHEEQEIDYTYSILSIDVGITHLGMAVIYTDEAYNLLEIPWVEMVDITKYTHDNDLKDKICTLQHTSCFADWLYHLFHEYETLFTQCDFILVERQPPQGLVAIEQIIYFQWRHKTYLVHPRSMHSHFNLGSLYITPNENGYEQRKISTVEIAKNICKWSTRAISELDKLTRKHDIADAICLATYWCYIRKKEYVKKINNDRVLNAKLTDSDLSVNDHFELYRYDPCNPK